MQIDGLVLGKYRIEKLINSGSFASVFRAKEELTNRTVAIKTLPKSVYPAGRMRYLLTELSAMGMNWGHPNIVSIHTVEPGNDEYVAYIVMEYMDGPSLRQLMTASPLSPHLAINIALDICRGMKAAHQHNIIHRDIKPQNILLTADRIAKISDFGVARILEATSDYAGTITGTRKYMAPEQYDGSYDYRADLYAVGLIIYEMFMGRFPFRGKDHDEIQMRKQCAEIEFNNEIPENLCEFLQKALHRDVKARYQTAAEIYDELEQIQKKWYKEMAWEIMERYSDSAIRHATLSKYREDLRLSTDAAEKIELEIACQQKIAEEQRNLLEVESLVNAHYDQALRYLCSTQSQRALQEMQQAHRLYLSDVQTAKTADQIFRRLADFMAVPKSLTTAKELIDCVNQLPVNEIMKFKAWFSDRFPPSELGESSAFSTSGEYTPDSASSSGLKHQPSPLQESGPESILQRLHQTIQNPHEMIAARIHQSAEKYAESRKRRARAEYKKLGEFYRESAAKFIESKHWELAADCYARSRLAYVVARRYGSARQSAREAGIYYARAAASLERGQDWIRAGRFYALSAEHYTHAELPEAADESRLRATICYFNVAENARAVGNLNLAYDYCEKTLMIAAEMQRASNAATGARKLTREIEALFQTESPLSKSGQSPL